MKGLATGFATITAVMRGGGLARHGPGIAETKRGTAHANFQRAKTYWAPGGRNASRLTSPSTNTERVRRSHVS